MCDDDDGAGGFLLNAFEMNSSSFVLHPGREIFINRCCRAEHSHSRNGYLIVSGHGSSDNYYNQFGLLLLYLTPLCEQQ